MSSIIILHAPDCLLQAKMLAVELHRMEYLVTTLSNLTRNSSKVDFQVARDELFSSAPATIIMGSSQLFNDSYFTQMAIIAVENKTFIPVLYGQIGLQTPAWFKDPIVLVGEGVNSELNWNHFLQRLNRFIGLF